MVRGVHSQLQGGKGYPQENQALRSLLPLDNHSPFCLPGAGQLALAWASSFHRLRGEPSYFQAEVISWDGTVLASTRKEGNSFESAILDYRVQKVARYSFQRTFSEYYRMKQGYDNWRTDISAPFKPVKCAVQSERKPLPRRIPYSNFRTYQPTYNVSSGKIIRDAQGVSWNDRERTAIGPKLKGYKVDELEVDISPELQKTGIGDVVQINKPYTLDETINLSDNSYQIVDFGLNRTGFIGIRVTCSKDTRLVLAFDEVLYPGPDVNFWKLRCLNLIGYELSAGSFELESFEPYVLRFLKIIVMEGQCRVEEVYLREYTHPGVFRAGFSCSDPHINNIFEASRESSRCNAVDVFMDCPSRERGAWLCDSAYAARAAYYLHGNTVTEKNFFENYMLAPYFRHLPDGVIPMCYPADQYDGLFIPNWSMWFVIQLDEYLARSGDRELVLALKPRVLALFDYFKQFENEDGLLEKLENWVFVGWSPANSYLQDVSYPSNMLYAAVLHAAGRMYDMQNLIEKAEQMRQVIREKSFTGATFTDHAVRKDDKLLPTDNRTSDCQYYAFVYDTATGKTHPELLESICDKLGRGKNWLGMHDEIFVGAYLRQDILSRYGRCRQLKDELILCYREMAEQSGTIWEFFGLNASANHGVGAHAAYCILRDLLGVYEIDSVNKRIKLRFSDVGLDWCKGALPVGNETLHVSWKLDGDTIKYHTFVPAGYKLEVQCLGDIKVECLPRGNI